MHEVVAVAFKEKYETEALLSQLRDLEAQSLIEISDWARVVKDAAGSFTIEHTSDAFGQLSTSGMIYFGLFGALLGWILTGGTLTAALFGLQVGGAVGWLAGAIAGHGPAVGLTADLLNHVGAKVPHGTDALLVMFKGPLSAGDVLSRVSLGDGKLLRAFLVTEQIAPAANPLESHH